MTTLTTEQQEAALNLIAEWLGKRGLGDPTCPHPEFTHTEHGYPFHGGDVMCPKPNYGPAPTGPDAARKALGPQLIPDWDWPSSGPTPTIVLEGGPYDWAYEVPVAVQNRLDELGIFAEPYAGYALCLYPA